MHHTFLYSIVIIIKQMNTRFDVVLLQPRALLANGFVFQKRVETIIVETNTISYKRKFIFFEK